MDSLTSVLAETAATPSRRQRLPRQERHARGGTAAAQRTSRQALVRKWQHRRRKKARRIREPKEDKDYSLVLVANCAGHPRQSERGSDEE